MAFRAETNCINISESAIARARARFGSRADQVRWIVADLTASPDLETFDLWHDRAVFHFLTAKADRQKYVETLKRTLAADGHVIIATFAIDGPLKCSGLDVSRYDAASVCAELGTGFRLVEQVDETHSTPWATEQKFSYFRFAKSADGYST